MTEVDIEYERRWKARCPALKKMARCAAMFAWTRQQIALRIRQEKPNLTDE